ncbi:hypothetical protein [Nocardia sp. NPDC050406]|uniref:hypothetical protein n=1 Tax=Nocardia sp. NPDC050406 TaxID=3364318 RepID=UPI0037A19F08
MTTDERPIAPRSIAARDPRGGDTADPTEAMAIGSEQRVTTHDEPPGRKRGDAAAATKARIVIAAEQDVTTPDAPSGRERGDAAAATTAPMVIAAAQKVPIRDAPSGRERGDAAAATAVPMRGAAGATARNTSSVGDRPDAVDVAAAPNSPHVSADRATDSNVAACGGPVRRRQEMVRGGVSDEEIRRLCAGGAWRRVRRGLYADRAAFADLGVAQRHRLLVAGVVPGLSVEAIVSHQSAAVLYGAPVWSSELERVCVTRNRRGGGRIRTDVKVHCAPVDAVAEVDGLAVTTPARTIVDLARTLPFEAAVVAGDAIARGFGVTAVDLAAELGTAKRRHGCTMAHRVAAFLDPHCARVGESRSRVMFRRLGVPVPQWRGEVFGPDGQRAGLVDCYFGDTGVVGLFDDRRHQRQRLSTLCDAVRADLRREEALRALGFQVVRWTDDDITSLEVGARVRDAVQRARRNPPPTGYLRQAALPTPRPLTIRKL